MTFKIPEVSKELVEECVQRIEPLILNRGKPWLILTKCEPFGQSYPWEHDLVAEATDIEELARIRTLHTWAYYGFFKPTYAEVIAQIPEELLSRVTHFLVNGPKTADDLNKHMPELDAGFHVAETILYTSNPQSSEYWEGELQP